MSGGGNSILTRVVDRILPKTPDFFALVEELEENADAFRVTTSRRQVLLRELVSSSLRVR